ncbi:MAG: PBP1A family penicillin-binding protein [Clostridia bacterium]|nr:PBP1A family penicillin-binding protein [Clostridia bacterium]
MSFIISLVWITDIFNWQKLDTDKIRNIQLSTRIYDKDNEEAFRIDGSVDRVYVHLDELPEYVSNAFIAAEDIRFYTHKGIDIRRIFGALVANLKSGGYSQGASTITQQLIKLTHLTSEKTLARKAQEAYLALQLEKAWSKSEILEAYINTVYYGGGAYGIDAAANRYFSKKASELTLSEAALLAGIIKAPSAYGPHINASAALQRRNYVISAMSEAGFISQADANSAVNDAITLNETIPEYTKSWYADQVCVEACDILDTDFETLIAAGYHIFSGYDPEKQLAADSTMSSSDIYPEEAAESALVAIDPNSGEIVALIGGKNYSARFGFNRAMAAKRQPGSLIKPISTYATAVENYHYLPTSFVYDVQREYSDGYMPGNSGGNFNGAVSMRYALSKSLNAATVDLADVIGIESIVATLSRFGIETHASDRNLALSLGAMTYGVTPAEMCASYAALANSGIYSPPHCIRKITDRNGNIVYEYEKNSARAVSDETAYIITDILKTAASEGTAKALRSVSIPVAAKTGTSGLENGDTADAWATAYTPDIAVTVWIGKDSNSNGGMAASVTGGGYAAPACAEFLKAIQHTLSGADFNMPSSLTSILIDSYALENEDRLLLATENTPAAYTCREIVRPDIEIPYSDIWEVPAGIDDLRLTDNSDGHPSICFTSTSNYSEYLIIRTKDHKSELIAVLQGKQGDSLVYEDADAAASQAYAYSVIPRHKLLYSLGATLTGPESPAITYSPKGFLNSLTSLFDIDNSPQKIESITRPLF